MSGATTLRPGYQAMLEAGREAAFDIVVAEALDRLSRDQEDIAALFKRLQFAGIQLVTLAEGEIGVLHIGLKGTMNALFLKDLADKTRRGLRGRVEAGKSGGGNAYGYDIARGYGGNGEPTRGDRTVNAAEAVTVRRYLPAVPRASPRAKLHSTSTHGAFPLRAAVPGAEARLTAIAAAARGCSTTRCISVVLSGIG